MLDDDSDEDEKDNVHKSVIPCKNRIVLYRGLLEDLESDADIAAIIGHEQILRYVRDTKIRVIHDLRVPAISHNDAWLPSITHHPSPSGPLDVPVSRMQCYGILSGINLQQSNLSFHEPHYRADWSSNDNVV
ncbi:unnamed protein product [Dovyalis caffra]|uniref:Peptidase M48 domain-containing protein n=1 Tax=Dovyalis caffra TaxID=77055 RepID=A0AAV1RS16_9ROSI|nr:unnamed protein product [Dovyalis caffra]